MIEKVSLRKLVLTFNNNLNKKCYLFICINSDSEKKCQNKLIFNKCTIHSYEMTTSCKDLIYYKRTDKDLLKAVIIRV